MQSSVTDVRRVAWLIAVLGIVGTVLALILSFDLAGAPPAIDEAADFPTRVLALQGFEQSRWPIDMAASLLFAVMFGAVVVLGALLAARTSRIELLALLGAGGILGLLSQLTHIGAHQVAVAIGYCDCGFKTEEVISQAWALMVTDGIADWFLNGAAILLAAGVVAAGRVLAGREMPAAWGNLSYLLAAVFVLGVSLSVIGVDGPISPLLIALVSGILLPAWASWLARALPSEAPGPSAIDPPR